MGVGRNSEGNTFAAFSTASGLEMRLYPDARCTSRSSVGGGLKRRSEDIFPQSKLTPNLAPRRL
jgi:hypothetical protein